jgi:anti-sigma regulatory factor (Ser/Thr protein kinase)
MIGSELRLRCPAQSAHVAPVRHALTAFLQALQLGRQPVEDITTAAGEALANIIEHAYTSEPATAEAYLELRAQRRENGYIAIEVADSGSFITRQPLPGRGFGLKIIRAIASQLTIDTSEGTCVRMVFDSEKMMHVTIAPGS